MDRTQPVNWTGRKLTHANATPPDWPCQRKMFGFGGPLNPQSQSASDSHERACGTMVHALE